MALAKALVRFRMLLSHIVQCSCSFVAKIENFVKIAAVGEFVICTIHAFLSTILGMPHTRI